MCVISDGALLDEANTLRENKHSHGKLNLKIHTLTLYAWIPYSQDLCITLILFILPRRFDFTLIQNNVREQ